MEDLSELDASSNAQNVTPRFHKYYGTADQITLSCFRLDSTKGRLIRANYMLKVLSSFSSFSSVSINCNVLNIRDLEHLLQKEFVNSIIYVKWLLMFHNGKMDY